MKGSVTVTNNVRACFNTPITIKLEGHSMVKPRKPLWLWIDAHVVDVLLPLMVEASSDGLWEDIN